MLNNRFNAAEIQFSNGAYLCKEWLTGYSLSNAIVYSTAVLLVVLNLIIVAILGRKQRPLSLNSADLISTVPHKDGREGVKHS
jgi:hypothetical protein